MRDISNLSPREWKAIAAQAEDEEDLALAATALDHLLKQNARDDILLARLFRVYSNGGQRQKALQLAESAFADGVRGRRLTSMYILSDFTSYNLPNCLDDIEAKLALFRHNPAVEGRAAMAYAWHGDVDRALDHARVAIARADEAATADMIRLMLARRVYQLSHRDAADRIVFRSDGRARGNVTADATILSGKISVCMATTRPAINIRDVQIGSGSRVSVVARNGAGACGAPTDL